MKTPDVPTMGRSAPPERVPTLTEVLDTTTAKPTRGVTASPPPVPVDAVKAADEGARAEQPDLSAEIAQQISAELQAHIDRVLDARVRAALEPILQQSVARVIEETRRELASTLQAGMARALAQQLSRHRNRR